MKKVFVLAVVMAAACTACATRTDTVTVDTPNGHQTTTNTRGPYNTTTNTTVNTLEQYNACIKQNSPTMGSSGADMYCRSQTSGTSGAMPGYGYGMPGYGYGGAIVPGRFPGYPGSAVVMVPDPTPVGVIAMENAGSGGRVVAVPGAAASGGASQQDVDDLARATKANHDAICRARPKDPVCCTDCDKGRK